MKKAILVAFLIMVAVGLVRAVTKPFDYDEVSHVHHAWLVSQGAVPYRDFRMNHLPFFWLAMAPLVRVLPESSASLLALRMLALAGQVLFLVFLLRALAPTDAPARRDAAFLLLPAVLWLPAMDFLVEFRPDSVGDALTFGSLCLWPALPAARFRRVIAAGALAAVGLLINSKYMLLPVFAAVCAVVSRRPSFRDALARASLFFAGHLVTIGVGVLLLVSRGLDLSSVYASTIGYETATAAGAGRPLIPALLGHPFALALATAALVLCAHALFTARMPRHPIVAAGLLFLLVQLFAAPRPWKQYTMTWLLLAFALGATTLVVTIPGRRVWPLVGSLAACLVVAFGFNQLVAPRVCVQLGGETRCITLAMQREAIDFLLANVLRTGRVVAPFPWHPVFRYDSMSRAMADYRGGRDMFVSDLQSAAAIDELVASPPSAVVLGLVSKNGSVEYEPYDPVLAHAIHSYLDARTDAYEMVLSPGAGIAMALKTR